MLELRDSHFAAEICCSPREFALPVIAWQLAAIAGAGADDRHACLPPGPVLQAAEPAQQHPLPGAVALRAGRRAPSHAGKRAACLLWHAPAAVLCAGWPAGRLAGGLLVLCTTYQCACSLVFLCKAPAACCCPSEQRCASLSSLTADSLRTSALSSCWPVLQAGQAQAIPQQSQSFPVQAYGTSPPPQVSCPPAILQQLSA